MWCKQASKQASKQARLILNSYFILLKEAAETVGLMPKQNTVKLKLKDVVEYSTERISAKYVDEKNYVGVDNLLKNKLGKVNSTHVPDQGNLI